MPWKENLHGRKPSALLFLVIGSKVAVPDEVGPGPDPTYGENPIRIQTLKNYPNSYQTDLINLFYFQNKVSI